MHPFMTTMLSMSRGRKRVLQLSVDLIVLASAFALSMLLKTDSFSFATDPAVWSVLIPVLPFTFFVFIRLGFYRAVLRYIAGRALFTILIGSALSGASMALMVRLAELPIPFGVPLLFTMMTFLMIGGVRFGFRELVSFAENRRKERVAIYGAGAAGRQLVQVLLQRSDYVPVAFIDDNRLAQGTHVGGLMVYSPKQIDRLIRNNGVNVILMAMPSATKARRSEILKSLENYPLLVQSVPGLDDIMSGKARIDQIDDVSVEDLLGRDPVPPRPELLGANIRDKVVLVTGAGGSIGGELCRQILRQKPKHLVLFEVSEPALYRIEQELVIMKRLIKSDVPISPVLGNVADAKHVARVLTQMQVQTVYHAAAYKHVPLVEQNIVQGVRNIVFGTRIVAETAIACGVESFILISTDKSVRPTNIMGASKRLAEMICQALAAKSGPAGTTISMVRFGNVLGSSGSVIPLFRRQIQTGGPITVTHPEITRFFMTIPEAAQLVIQAGAMAKGGEVFVLDMGDPVRIAELAAKMARLHGLKPVLVGNAGTDLLGPSEIGITFTHLRPGEKLHEELLIGNDPKATEHPRIMSASEVYQPMSDLYPALEQLEMACDRNDIAKICKIFMDQKTAYQPNSAIVDQFWPAEGDADLVAVEKQGPEKPAAEKVAADAPYLTLVHG